MIFEEGDLRRSPWFYQPDPERLVFVPAKAEKIVRRGPRQYFMVGRKPDGSVVEFRLMPLIFKMEGI